VVLGGSVIVVLVGDASERSDAALSRSETAPTGSVSSGVEVPVAPMTEAAPKPSRAPPATATFQFMKRCGPASEPVESGVGRVAMFVWTSW
jgi:hypothetical protein